LRTQTNQIPLNSSTISADTTLWIRAIGSEAITWMASLSSAWLAFAPTNFFVFEGASFALFASGNGNPWPFNAPDVGFKEVNEVYFDEDIPDYDIWT
jgi:hypothetical protein